MKVWKALEAGLLEMEFSGEHFVLNPGLQSGNIFEVLYVGTFGRKAYNDLCDSTIERTERIATIMSELNSAHNLGKFDSTIRCKHLSDELWVITGNRQISIAHLLTEAVAGSISVEEIRDFLKQDDC